MGPARLLPPPNDRESYAPSTSPFLPALRPRAGFTPSSCDLTRRSLRRRTKNTRKTIRSSKNNAPPAPAPAPVPTALPPLLLLLAAFGERQNFQRQGLSETKFKLNEMK